MSETRAPAHVAPLLFLNVFIIATCGLVYELLAGTLASYVLGDSVTQFSLVIGFYLSAMGAGAFFSRLLDRDLARRFLDVELAVALVGGLSAPALFIAFGRLQAFAPVLYGVVISIGILVGLELPLLMRLLAGQMEFKDLVSRVLTFDYVGALVASLLFPLLFVPRLGLVRTSLLMGMLNAGVALGGSHLLAPWLGRRGPLAVRVRGGLVLLLLLAAFIKADWLSRLAEEELYADEIVFTQTTPYQRIVVTSSRAGRFQLFLNGNLQFSSADEYRYHEALVHPAMEAAAAGHRVLILGGGDGLALREVLAHPEVQQVTLVDLDPAMTRLAAQLRPLRQLNRASMSDPRVRVVNEDALVWLGDAPRGWDVVIVDFPDPNSFALGKLYTTRFYRLVRRALAPGGAVAVQATSPLFARRSFWCIVATMRAAGFTVHPYHTAVPSFGVWGFALARAEPFDPPMHAPAGLHLRYLDDSAMAALFRFPADMAPVAVDINQLDDQMLVRYYESEWRRWED